MVLTLSALALSGCLAPSAPGVGTSAQTVNSPNAQPSAAPAPAPGGARAVRIIFKQNYPSGSFDAPPSGGTPPGPGLGLQATRVFNADGSLLANCSNSPTSCMNVPGWPQWLSGVELGISGSANASATNPDCARFTGVSETGHCNYGNGASANCAALGGYYRVSEYDCAQTPVPNLGTGGPSDGIYVRANFVRSNLGPTENLLAVIEYAASSANPPPQNPANCFKNGVFDPVLAGPQCADFAWRIYIKHSSGEVVQPYLLLAPPFFGGVNFVSFTGGAGATTKQFVIPLAGDPGLQTVQISRISSGLTPSTTIIGAPTSNGLVSGKTPWQFMDVCAAAGTPSNSPLCSGMVLYSMTFFRI